jgi:hypothetical protein
MPLDRSTAHLDHAAQCQGDLLVADRFIALVGDDDSQAGQRL